MISTEQVNDFIKQLDELGTELSEAAAMLRDTRGAESGGAQFLGAQFLDGHAISCQQVARHLQHLNQDDV